MTAKVVKKTIEKTIDNEQTSEKVVHIEIAIMNDDTEIGHLDVNEYGGHFNLTSGVQDVEAAGIAIANALKSQA